MRANYQPEMFWNRVEQLRKMRGITMQELSTKIGKGPSAFRSMAAEKRMMRLQDALAIADCFGCSISYLFFGTPDHRGSAEVQEAAKKRGVASGGLISAVYANEGRPIRDQLNNLIPYLNARQCNLLMDYLSQVFGVGAKVDETMHEEVRTVNSKTYSRPGYGNDYTVMRDNFRRNFKDYLDRNGLSYTRFAEIVGLPRTTITDCMKKDNLYGMVSTYGIIAEACGWSLRQMLSDNPDRPDVDDGAVMDESTWRLVRQELQEVHSSKTHLLNVVNLQPENDSYPQFCALNEMCTTLLKLITSLAVGF